MESARLLGLSVVLLVCQYLILGQGRQVLALRIFVTDLVLNCMREENRWLFSSFCCSSSQKEIIHRNLCVWNIFVVLKGLLMPVLAVSQLIHSIQTCCQLLGHRSDKYLVVDSTVLHRIVHSKAQVLVGSQLNGAHRLLS